MKTCAHFGLCGGCSLQNLSPEDYRVHKRDHVVQALTRAGLSDMKVEAPVEVPDFSRRRAAFGIEKRKGVVDMGFRIRGSHDIVDMRECLVLAPALLALTQTARAALTPILHDGEKVELLATDSDTGLDLALHSARKLTPALTAQLAKAFAGSARVRFNNEILMEETAPAVTIAGATVKLPPEAFLQATREGEAALQSHVLALTKGSKNIVDLFAGLGTFTFALARTAKVHAVEQDRAALDALAAAARNAQGLKPITTERRDLFKLPLSFSELKAFDMAVLDPPREGAEAQIREIAASKLSKVAYVSCDAATFARDAAILAKAGFKPGPVTPIDQFRYSGHIELVAGFARETRA